MFESNPLETLQKSFHQIDRDFVALCKRNGITDGTTAIVSLIHNRNVYVANAGDSRGIMVQRGGRVVPLSFDHKPSRYPLFFYSSMI
jgi:serine/threonine protein phosphatase PrpC